MDKGLITNLISLVYNIKDNILKSLDDTEWTIILSKQNVVIKNNKGFELKLGNTTETKVEKKKKRNNKKNSKSKEEK